MGLTVAVAALKEQSKKKKRPRADSIEELSGTKVSGRL
jgi:hypothetical protein